MLETQGNKPSMDQCIITEVRKIQQKLGGHDPQKPMFLGRFGTPGPQNQTGDIFSYKIQSEMSPKMTLQPFWGQSWVHLDSWGYVTIYSGLLGSLGPFLAPQTQNLTSNAYPIIEV